MWHQNPVPIPLGIFLLVSRNRYAPPYHMCTWKYADGGGKGRLILSCGNRMGRAHQLHLYIIHLVSFVSYRWRCSIILLCTIVYLRAEWATKAMTSQCVIEIRVFLFTFKATTTPFISSCIRFSSSMRFLVGSLAGYCIWRKPILSQ